MRIRLKLVLMLIALIFLVMVVAGTFIILSLRRDAEQDARAQLAWRAEHIYREVIYIAFFTPDFEAQLHTREGRAAFESLFTHPFTELVATHLPEPIHAFILCARDRQTLESSTGSRDFLTYSVVIAALEGSPSFSAWREYAGTGAWFEYARPIFLTNGPLPDYVIYVRYSAADFLARQGETIGTIALASLLAFVVASILAAIFAGTITQNLLLLNRAITSFNFSAGGDSFVINESADEIGQLTRSFNSMASKLNQNMAAITNEKSKMEIIMYNMTDGVLVYDTEGGLIHSNYACEELINLSDIGSYTMEALFEKIGVTLPEGKTPHDMVDTTVELGDKFISAGFNPFKNVDGKVLGVIIVLQDITRHMRLDNMRKEFVANVSHEIRTPLTTIKSYAETLLDVDDEEMRQRFLNIINGEADRMAAIVKDLLELSQFDSKKMDFVFKEEDLVNLVRNNVKSHALHALHVGKEIVFTSDPDAAVIMMDATRISQVLDNIITNSFRYSQEGAQVRVDIHESGLHYMVYISDNGIGIPKEDLRMIFERFYRVDKARSREHGGTGLGLAIAKEIVEAHGGRISVNSEIGVGTTMMIRFPK